METRSDNGEYGRSTGDYVSNIRSEGNEAESEKLKRNDNINMTRDMFATLHKAIDEREEQTISDIRKQHIRENAFELSVNMYTVHRPQSGVCSKIYPKCF